MLPKLLYPDNPIPSISILLLSCIKSLRRGPACGHFLHFAGGGVGFGSEAERKNGCVYGHVALAACACGYRHSRRVHGAFQQNAGGDRGGRDLFRLPGGVVYGAGAGGGAENAVGRGGLRFRLQVDIFWDRHGAKHAQDDNHHYQFYKREARGALPGNTGIFQCCPLYWPEFYHKQEKQRLIIAKNIGVRPQARSAPDVNCALAWLPGLETIWDTICPGCRIVLLKQADVGSFTPILGVIWEMSVCNRC